MKFDFDKIKNIAKDVSKEVVNVVGDKYLEIKANANFDDGKYDEVIKAANDILKLDKFNYEIVLLKAKALMKQNKYDEAIEAFIEALAIDDTKIEPLLHIASINEIQGNTDDAIDIYNSIIEKENSNSSALLGLARSYYIKKEYENVNNYYIQIQSIDIKLINDEDYYKWGISLKELNDFEKAKAKLKQANSLCPSDKYSQAINDIKNEELQPLKDKAYNFFSNKEFNKTIHMFTRLNFASTSILTHEDFYTWGLCLEEKGKDKDAVDKFKKAYDKKQCDKYLDKINSIESKHKNAFDNIIDKAIDSYNNKQYLDADKYFSKASEEWDMTHDQYFIWGICLMNMEEVNQAKNKFKKANSLNPCSKYLNAYKNELLKTSNTTLLLKEAKKCYNENIGEALKYINKILELDSKNIEALLMKGDILLRENNQLSWTYYEKVLELDPSNEKANELINFKKEKGINTIDRYWLEIGIKELNDRNYTEAENALNMSLEFNPNNAKAWSKLCVLYQNQKNYPKALEAINKSLNIYSKSDQAWFNKGQTLFWMGEFRTSIQCFNRAIRLNPDECDDAYAIRGMAFIRLNKKLEGIGSLYKSLRNNPKNKLALEAIKHTNGLDIEIQEEDYITSSRINLSPKICARMRVIPHFIDSLHKKGINIDFEFNPLRMSRLTHDSKEYFFDNSELDGAFAYVLDIWHDEYMAEDFGDYGKLEL